MAHVDDPQENAPQEAAIETLVADYQKRGFSRRAFIQRSLALGLSLSAASALLAACGGTSSGSSVPTNNTKTLTLLTTWGGEEQDSFKAVVAPFTQSTGINVNITATRDVNAQLTILLRGNNPPDIAILPNPGKMQELAAQHKLLAFNSFIDMNQINNDYASSWTDLGSYPGQTVRHLLQGGQQGNRLVQSVAVHQQQLHDARHLAGYDYPVKQHRWRRGNTPGRWV